MSSDDFVSRLETMAARAWPPLVVEEIDGWVARWSRRFSYRANSIWPRHHSDNSHLASKLDRAEAFYRERDAQPLFQITPSVQPLDLDAVLASAGYEFLDESEFMTASIADVLRVEADPRFEVTIAVDLNPTWYSHWCGASEECDGDKDAGLQILKAVEDQSAFALCTQADVVVAVGRGVLADGWLGVFNMATYPLNRGAGAGKAVLAHLARWAAQNWGVSDAYLQLDTDNAAARALYAAAGFELRYKYHYRVATK